MRQALSDVVEVCSNARARAILQGKEVCVVFHPRDNRLELEGGGGQAAGSGQVTVGLTPGAGGGTSAQLSDRVQIQALGINLLDYTVADSARVRFFPNGTCDEMLLILQSDRNEYRGVSLEVTTGLASVLSEAELTKLRNRLR
jgi:hypothetical protein